MTNEKKNPADGNRRVKKDSQQNISIAPVKVQSVATLPEPPKDRFAHNALAELARKDIDAITIELALKELAKQTEITRTVLRKEFQEKRRQFEQEKHSLAIKPPTPEQIAEADALTATREQENTEIEKEADALFLSADVCSIFLNDFDSTGYVAGEEFAKSLLLSHGARLLTHSTAFTVYGASSSGKSAAVIKAAQFLPPEIQLNITSLSEQALFYLGNLSGKYVMFGEVKPLKPGEDDYRQTAERQLISENRVVRTVVEKSDGNTNVAVEKMTEGPCVLTSTTTAEPNAFCDEYANRRSWIRSDGSEAMTKEVLKRQSKKAAKPWDENADALARSQAKWHAYHRKLQPMPVAIPYASYVEPTSRHTTVRRLFELLLDYVKISCLLHQGTRERESHDGQEFLIATFDDYTLAYALLDRNAPRVLDLCSKPALAALEVIKPFLPMPTGAIQAQLKEPRETVRRWLWELVNAGLLVIEDTKYGRQNKYCMGSEPSAAHELGLIEPNELLKKISHTLAPTVNSRAMAEKPNRDDHATVQSPFEQVRTVEHLTTQVFSDVQIDSEQSEAPTNGALERTTQCSVAGKEGCGDDPF